MEGTDILQLFVLPLAYSLQFIRIATTDCSALDLLVIALRAQQSFVRRSVSINHNFVQRS